MTRSHPPSLLAAFSVIALATTPITAQVIFSDDFNDPNGTVLPGKAPDIGQNWTQPTGNAMVVQNGIINTAGGGRVAFANFTERFDGSTHLLKLTVDFSSLSHNSGYAGVSLFDGTQERIFFGDPTGANPSLGFLANGTQLRASPVTPSGQVTLLYDFNTGRIGMYKGDSVSGPFLGSLTVPSGWGFDRIRIANGNSGDLALNSISVEMMSSAPPAIDSFKATPQIAIDGFGHILEWKTSFADEIVLSPGADPVLPNDSVFVEPPPGDATYQLTATDSVTSATVSKTVTIRTVIGGTASFRYLRFTPLKTRGDVPWTQLSEMYFYHDSDAVIPVAVTSPGAQNPSAVEDFEKIIDGDITTKWLDYASTPLIFDFGVPTAVDSYSFATANDASDRDPVRWTFEGSDDGTTWQLVENVTSFDYLGTELRRATVDIIPIPGASLLPFLSFTGNTATLVSGDPLTFTYQTIGAVSVTYNDGSGDESLALGAGGFVVYPTASTTYTVTATNDAGLVSMIEVPITVISPTINEINYADFDDSGEELSLIGTATISNDYPALPLPGDTDRLRLTGAFGYQSGTAWFRERQAVGNGFETNFGMHITRTDGKVGADGMAFIIQNSAKGSALAVANAEMGVATQALTIGFDTYQNAGEPSAALLRVASAGTVLALVDLTTIADLPLRGPARLLDSTGQAAPYQVRIVYDGAVLNIDLDGIRILSGLAVNLDALGAVDELGTAFVGFAARTVGSGEAHDITSWKLTSGSSAGPLRLISSDIDTATGQVSLTWESVAGRHYRITTSVDLVDWSTVLVPDVTGQAGQTTTTASFTGGSKGFFRVEEIPSLPK